MNDLRQLWLDIKESIVSGPTLPVSDLRLMEAGAGFPEGQALVGMSIRGIRHLLIPVPEETPVFSDIASQGVHIEVRSLLQSGVERQFLDVSCHASDLEDLFSVVAADILHAGLRKPDEVVGAAVATLGRWRELLRETAGRVLSRGQLVGLFGELVVLRELLRNHPEALRCWAGPEKGRHDFISTWADIEVKTTTSLSARSVRINGLGQLARHGDTPLFLALVRVIHPTAEGGSVPDLVAEVQALGASGSRLFSLLAEAGYHPADVARYRDQKIELSAVEVFEVANDFPRLTPVNLALPDGVHAVDYAIDLEHPACVSLDDEARAALWRGVATSEGTDA